MLRPRQIPFQLWAERKSASETPQMGDGISSLGVPPHASCSRVPGWTGSAPISTDFAGLFPHCHSCWGFGLPSSFHSGTAWLPALWHETCHQDPTAFDTVCSIYILYLPLCKIVGSGLQMKIHLLAVLFHYCPVIFSESVHSPFISLTWLQAVWCRLQ